MLYLPRWHGGKESAGQCRARGRCRFKPCVGKIPWRRKWQPTPVFLPGKFHGQRSLAGYSLWGCKDLDMKSYDQPSQHIKKQKHYLVNKGPSGQGYGVSSGHVWMWELDCEESWALKNWCFWTVVLEKTLESPLDCKKIQPVHPEGDQSWVFIGRTDAESETPILWPPHVKSWLTGKDPDAGKDWGQEEKGMTEDEMPGWHHWLNGREFE